MSGSDAWAVGFDSSYDTPYVEDTLILHWNGTAWTQVKNPSPNSVSYNEAGQQPILQPRRVLAPGATGHLSVPLSGFLSSQPRCHMVTAVAHMNKPRSAARRSLVSMRRSAWPCRFAELRKQRGASSTPRLDRSSRRAGRGWPVSGCSGPSTRSRTGSSAAYWSRAPAASTAFPVQEARLERSVKVSGGSGPRTRSITGSSAANWSPGTGLQLILTGVGQAASKRVLGPDDVRHPECSSGRLVH